MNKKGFTLVELLAVIVILGLVMTIVGTKGFGAFDNTKKAITRQNESAIKEAANVLMTEVKECDEELSKDIIEYFVGDEKTCSDLKAKASTEDCLDISLEYMIKNNFITGNGANDVLKTYPNYTVKGCLDNEKSNIKLPTKDELEKDDDTKNPQTPGEDNKETDNTKNPQTPDEDNKETDNTLAAVIIKNAKKVTDSEKQSGFAEYRETPLTQPAVEISGKNENTLSKTEDDYGNSYYFRGSVKNNYVDFAGMCWRVVRILGDKSVKLILEDQDSTCATSDGNWNIGKGNFGYKFAVGGTLVSSNGTKSKYGVSIANYLNADKKETSSMAYAFKNYQETLNSKIETNYTNKTMSDYLKIGDWCFNDKVYAKENINDSPLTEQEIIDKRVNMGVAYYDSDARLCGNAKAPTLKCNGTKMKKFGDNTDMYIGTLTADEIVYAGAKADVYCPNNYLINDYQKNNSLYFWSLSPMYISGTYDRAFTYFSGSSGFSDCAVTDNSSFRPALTLLSGIKITTGTGTQSDPYVIK